MPDLTLQSRRISEGTDDGSRGLAKHNGGIGMRASKISCLPIEELPTHSIFECTNGGVEGWRWAPDLLQINKSKCIITQTHSQACHFVSFIAKRLQHISGTVFPASRHQAPYKALKGLTRPLRASSGP